MHDDTPALIEAILRSALPDECRTVGPTNVRDIARLRGAVRLAPLEGAARLDWGTALAILASAATIVNLAVDIVRALRDRKDKSTNEIVVELRMSLPDKVLTGVSEQVVHQLVDVVRQKFVDPK